MTSNNNDCLWCERLCAIIPFGLGLLSTGTLIRVLKSLARAVAAGDVSDCLILSGLAISFIVLTFIFGVFAGYIARNGFPDRWK